MHMHATSMCSKLNEPILKSFVAWKFDLFDCFTLNCLSSNPRESRGRLQLFDKPKQSMFACSFSARQSSQPAVILIWKSEYRFIITQCKCD